MNSNWIRVVAMAAMLAAPPATFAQGIRQQRVSFKPGSSSASISGSIKGDETVDYLLRARAGQTMRVSMKTSNGANYFNVLPPGSEAAIAIGATLGNKWSGVLPVNGEYKIRVFLMRSAARRKETARFTLSVGIIPASEDARVPGTTYHATGDVPCSIGPDAPGSALCSFGVVRLGPGRADVYLADPGYNVKLHNKQLRVLHFDGKSVTSANPNEKVSVSMQSDNWIVVVNDFYHYIISDAVINGG